MKTLNNLLNEFNAPQKAAMVIFFILGAMLIYTALTTSYSFTL